MYSDPGSPVPNSDAEAETLVAQDAPDLLGPLAGSVDKFRNRRGAARWAGLTDGAWHHQDYPSNEEALRARAALCAWARYNGYRPVTRVVGERLMAQLFRLTPDMPEGP